MQPGPSRGSAPSGTAVPLPVFPVLRPPAPASLDKTAAGVAAPAMPFSQTVGSMREAAPVPQRVGGTREAAGEEVVEIIEILDEEGPEEETGESVEPARVQVLRQLQRQWQDQSSRASEGTSL